MKAIKQRNIIFYITYTVILIAALIKLDELISAFTQLFILFIPLFLGGAVAFVLKKPYDLIYSIFERHLNIKNKSLIRLLAAISVYFMLFAAIAAVISFIVPQLSESWRLLNQSLNMIIPDLYKKLEALQRQLPISIISDMSESLSLSRISDFIGKLLVGAMPQIYSVTNSIFRSAANIIMGLVFSVYILLSREAIAQQSKRIVQAFLNEKWCLRLTNWASVSNDIFTRFVSGQLTEAFILGGLCFAGMILFRLDYALLISVLIGITSLIPIVGAFIGAIPSAFILFMISPQKSVIFIVFLVVLQQFEGNVIYPKVVGSSIGLPPIWILLAITVGGGMFGVLGMMVSVPATSVVYKLVCDDIDERLKSKENS